MAIRAPRDVGPRLSGAGEEIDLTSDAPVEIEELWEHRAELHRLCAKIVGDPVTADDMVQETYLRALKNLDKLERRPSLMPWLATVARRRSLDEIRSRKKVSPYEFMPEDETREDDDPEIQAELGESVGEVADAMRVLNERERRLLELQVADGLSLAEMAEADGSSVHSVRSVLVRARAKLRAAITEEIGVPAAGPLALAGLWARRRLHDINVRVQEAFSSAPLDRIGEIVTAGAIAVVLGATPVPPDSLDAAPAGSTADATAATPASTAAAPAQPSTPAGGGNATPEAAPGGPVGEPLPASAAVGLLLPPDDVEDTDDAAFTSFAVTGPASSPVVLAAGTRRQGCVAGCTVLFRSLDGGARWERLAAEGITGADVVAAPGYPLDPRIFASGDQGLSVSRDGGRTFEPILAGGPAPIALSPAFAEGDERVFVGTNPAVVWNDRTRSTTPLLGPPTAPSAHFAFQPGYPDAGALFVGSAAPGSGDFEAAVYRCRSTFSEDSCVDATTIPALDRPPEVAVVRASGTVLAWGGSQVFRSTDGGATFSTTAIPGDLHVRDVDSTSAGLIVAAAYSPSGATAGILRSHDGGRSWQLTGGGTALAEGAASVTSLPSGRLLAAPLAQAGGDLYCSDDGGGTWGTTCA